MTFSVVFRRPAQAEFDEAALWYEERRQGLGAQFLSEVRGSIEAVAEHP